MKRKHALGVLLIAGCLLGSALAVRHISSKRVVLRTVTPNGMEFCIVQRLDDPFNTSAYYRRANGRWGVFYYDHEDWYWGKGDAVADQNEKTLKIYRGGKVTATFNWESEAFTLVREGREWRTTVGDQWWLDQGKNPWE